jgi:glutathionyl-hydroquinone reductase
MGKDGWPFSNVDDFPGANSDPLYNASHVKDLYFKAEPNYTGRCVPHTIYSKSKSNTKFDSSTYRFTVPVLWDKKTHTIVNNESSEIIRIFNKAFNDVLPADKAAVDITPEAHLKEIDALNEWVYDTVNSFVLISYPIHDLHDLYTFPRTCTFRRRVQSRLRAEPDCIPRRSRSSLRIP